MTVKISIGMTERRTADADVLISGDVLSRSLGISKRELGLSLGASKTDMERVGVSESLTAGSVASLAREIMDGKKSTEEGDNGSDSNALLLGEGKGVSDSFSRGVRERGGMSDADVDCDSVSLREGDRDKDCVTEADEDPESGALELAVGEPDIVGDPESVLIALQEGDSDSVPLSLDPDIL